MQTVVYIEYYRHNKQVLMLLNTYQMYSWFNYEIHKGALLVAIWLSGQDLWATGSAYGSVV